MARHVFWIKILIFANLVTFDRQNETFFSNFSYDLRESEIKNSSFLNISRKKSESVKIGKF